jgi:hypothetical protein
MKGSISRSSGVQEFKELQEFRSPYRYTRGDEANRRRANGTDNDNRIVLALSSCNIRLLSTLNS